MNEGAEVEMPRYRCHKEVWALKLKEVRRIFQDERDAGQAQSGGAVLVFEEPGYAPLLVDVFYFIKHEPKAGGYYVVYDDGYKSWSPAEAFEAGYARVK